MGGAYIPRQVSYEHESKGFTISRRATNTCIYLFWSPHKKGKIGLRTS